MMAKLSDTKVSLAALIPWALVLVLGTLKVSEFTHPPLSPPSVDQVVNTGGDSGEEEAEVEGDEVAESLAFVESEFNKIENEDDRILIYKLLSGAAEYLKHAKNLNNTSQFDPILARVQTSYGWNRERYPEFTDAISSYLVAAGYDEPRKLDSQQDRDWFQGIFESLSGAVKL